MSVESIGEFPGRLLGPPERIHTTQEGVELPVFDVDGADVRMSVHWRDTHMPQALFQTAMTIAEVAALVADEETDFSDFMYIRSGNNRVFNHESGRTSVLYMPDHGWRLSRKFDREHDARGVAAFVSHPASEAGAVVFDRTPRDERQHVSKRMSHVWLLLGTDGKFAVTGLPTHPALVLGESPQHPQTSQAR